MGTLELLRLMRLWAHLVRLWGGPPHLSPFVRGLLERRLPWSGAAE